MSENFWKKLSYWLGLLPLGAIFGLVFYLAHLEIKDLDLWLHIGVGRYIVTNGVVPFTDILSCSIAGTPWVNHEWLFQVIVYNIFQTWGPDGLIQMQVVIVTLTMALLLILGYNKDKQLILILTLYLVGMVYHQRFTIRPDLYSLFFFTFYIFVLSLHIDKKWSVAALVITQVLWSNIHGFFFFGPLFLLIGLVSEWLKRHARLPYQWNKSGRLNDGEYKRLKIMFGLVILACLVNPYFVEGAVYPLRVFFSLSGENKVFFEHIQELQRPLAWNSLFVSNDFLFYKVLILLSVVTFIFNRRRIDISALLFWLVFFIFSIKAARNVAFFALAAYLVILTNALNIFYKDIVPLRFTDKKFMHLTSAIAKLLFLVWVFQSAEVLALQGYYDLDKYERKSEFGGVSLRSYPDKAVDFLERNDIRGNFFNDFNSGAYLVGRVFPNIKVFIDGRTEVYGGKFFAQYRKMWEEGDSALFEEAIKKYNLTGALLNSARQHIPEKVLKYFYENKGWAVVYFDYDAVIFLRRVPENQEYIDQFAVDLTQWQPIKLDMFKLGTSPVSPFSNYFRAFTLESLDLDEQALAETQEAVKIAPGYGEIHELMGKIYAKRKQYEEAFVHFRVAALGAPNDNRTRHNFALCYFDLGKYEGAIKQYLRIIELWPTDPKGYFLLAKTYAKDRQYDRALSTLRKAHQMRPDDAQDIVGVGDIIYEQGDYAKAGEAYALALETKKDLGLAHKKLGFTYKAMGEQPRALEEFRKSFAINAVDEEVKKELGPEDIVEK